MIEFDARVNDGHTAVARAVHVRVDGSDLILRDSQGSELARWPIAELRLIDEPSRGAVGRLIAGVGRPERLLFESPQLVTILAELSADFRNDPYGRGWGWKVVTAWSFAAIAGLAGLVFIVIPLFAHQVAVLLPPQVEARTGRWIAEAVIDTLGHAKPNRGLCYGPEGIAALERLIDQFSERAHLPTGLTVRVLDLPIVNAIALPGGQVMVFRGLIDRAESPPAVAGVLAHEIAHVELRHPTEIAVKQTSTGFLIGLFFGDVAGMSVAGSMAQNLIGASYTRDAEAAADARAMELLRAAGITTHGFADFMDKAAKEEAGGTEMFAYLASHPPSAERARRARAADAGGGAGLSEAEWAALKSICGATAD